VIKRDLYLKFSYYHHLWGWEYLYGLGGDYLIMVSEFEQREIEFKKRMRKHDLTALLGMGLFLGMIGGVFAVGGYYMSRDRNIEFCTQSAEQRFSPGLCSDACFRDSYFELHKEWKIDDLDLAYQIAIKKCEDD